MSCVEQVTTQIKLSLSSGITCWSSADCFVSHMLSGITQSVELPLKEPPYRLPWKVLELSCQH